MRYFRLEPPSPGHAFEEKDAQGVVRTVFAWNFASGDPIFAHARFFFVPRSFAERLWQRRLNGYSLAPVDTRSGEAPIAAPVLRLVVDGRAGVDDFGMQTKTTLVVSGRVVAAMREHGVTGCRFHDYDPSYRVPTPEELMRTFKEPGRS